MRFGREPALVDPTEALPGRDEAVDVTPTNVVTGLPMTPPWPAGSEVAEFALGCFWGAERRFWETPGVLSTAVGYAGGVTPNPTYREVCSGRTNHAEAVLVVFDPALVSYDELLRVFWEAHDPTQGHRQGNDIGSQYRSAVYTTSDDQQTRALASRDAYQAELDTAGWGAITTEIVPAGEFFYAEDDHQQYLSKNPAGYCGLGGTGVACPTGFTRADP